MKQLVPNYTFNKTAKTVTFTDFGSIKLERVLLITNVNTNTVIYNFAEASLGGTVSGNVLTLDFDTTTMLDTDPLMVLYESKPGDPDYSRVVNIETERNTFREDFDGTALDPAKWITTLGTGTAVSVTSSLLTLSAGTTADAVATIRSKKSFRLPFRVQFTFQTSQRITGNKFFLEVTNADGSTHAAYLLQGTSATASAVVAQHAGFKAVADTNVASNSTTAQYCVYDLDLRAESVDYSEKTPDQVAGLIHRATRSRTVPEPDEEYFIQIRSVNDPLATAPASNTDLRIDTLLVQDSTKLTAEITGGRGYSGGSRKIPVVLTTGIIANQSTTSRQGLMATAGSWVDETSANLGASATFTGTAFDLSNAVHAATFGSASNPQEVRYSATSSHAGTLYVEHSRDNTNWHRIKMVALAQPDTTTRFYGEIVHKPSTRFLRCVFVNGGTATTTLMVQSFRMAN